MLRVREIIRMPPVTKMPNTPHYVEGIINLWGKVIPIISMRKRFGLPEVDHTSHTRIMVMDVDRMFSHEEREHFGALQV